MWQFLECAPGMLFFYSAFDISGVHLFSPSPQLTHNLCQLAYKLVPAPLCTVVKYALRGTKLACVRDWSRRTHTSSIAEVKHSHLPYRCVPQLPLRIGSSGEKRD